MKKNLLIIWILSILFNYEAFSSHAAGMDIIYNEDNGKWDGTQNGKMVNNGLYTYLILVYDFKNKPFIYTGLVTLIK